MDAVFLEVTENLRNPPPQSPGSGSPDIGPMQSRWIPASKILSIILDNNGDAWSLCVEAAGSEGEAVTKTYPVGQIFQSQEQAESARVQLVMTLQDSGTGTIKVVRWQGTGFVGKYH